MEPHDEEGISLVVFLFKKIEDSVSDMAVHASVDYEVKIFL